MPLLATITKQIRNQVFTAQLSSGRVLSFTAAPTVSLAATSSLFSAPAPTEKVSISLHATDLTLLGRLPATINADFLEFITDTLDRHGAKRLLVVDPANVAALEAKGYQISRANADKAVVSYDRVKTNLMGLAAKSSERAAHFLAHQNKLASGDWEFVHGYGADFIKKINPTKLYEFYQSQCPFARGGFKTQYATYSEEGMIARFGYPDDAVMSFAIQTKNGDLIAANHLLFTKDKDDSVAYCYDNVIHEKYRSHDLEDSKHDSQHLYQFFLSQIALALAKEEREPKFISIILGADGQAGKGHRLKQLLIADHAESAETVLPILMFKGSEPQPFIVAAIADEKAIAMQNLTASVQGQHTDDAEHQPKRGLTIG